MLLRPKNSFVLIFFPFHLVLSNVDTNGKDCRKRQKMQKLLKQAELNKEQKLKQIGLPQKDK